MKILLSISLLLFLCLPSYGQEDSVSSHLNIGITVSTGLSMFIGSVPKDLNNLPCPAFSVGLLDIIPTGNEDISILAGLTYDMRAFLLKDTFNGQRQTIRLHYLSIPAGFKWQRFFMAAS